MQLHLAGPRRQRQGAPDPASGVALVVAKSEYPRRGDEQDTPRPASADSSTAAEEAAPAEELLEDDPAHCEVAFGEGPEGEDEAQDERQDEHEDERIDLVEGDDSEPEEGDEGVHQQEEAVVVVPLDTPFSIVVFC